MDVTIRGVPDGAEDSVKELACAAVERFIRARDLQTSKSVEDKFQADVDAVRVSNGLPPKFRVKEPKEPEEPKP